MRVLSKTVRITVDVEDDRDCLGVLQEMDVVMIIEVVGVKHDRGRRHVNLVR